MKTLSILCVIVAVFAIGCSGDAREVMSDPPRIVWLSWSDSDLHITVMEGEADIEGFDVTLYENGEAYTSVYIDTPECTYTSGEAWWHYGLKMPHPGRWRIGVRLIDTAGMEGQEVSTFVNTLKNY
jgi:hypothetical protein